MSGEEEVEGGFVPLTRLSGDTHFAYLAHGTPLQEDFVLSATGTESPYLVAKPSVWLVSLFGGCRGGESHKTTNWQVAKWEKRNMTIKKRPNDIGLVVLERGLYTPQTPVPF
jgi:hypothetical protein